MTIIEALKNALAMLKTEGNADGDEVMDLELAISRLEQKYPKIASEEL
jgi:hypothetical protein